MVSSTSLTNCPDRAPVFKFLQINSLWDYPLPHQSRTEIRKESTTRNVRPKIAGQDLSLLGRINSHEDFADAVLRIYDAFGMDGNDQCVQPLERAYYLLGWLAGDAVKQFAAGSPKARIGIGLCKKHPENLALGEYVSECIRTLGVPVNRIADEPSRESEPHGSFRWLSSYSLVVSWLKAACLGLTREELTSYVPVKMDWLFTAPNELRLWFLRGLADSDGTVNLRNKAVFIVTSPNTKIVRGLLDSVGCHNTAGLSKGVGVVAISGADAARIQIFNPDIFTHRRKLLEKMCNAAVYQRHWPEWLEARVEELVCQGLDSSTIRDTLLSKDNVYVKLKTLNRKARRLSETSQRRDSISGPPALPPLGIQGRC